VSKLQKQQLDEWFDSEVTRHVLGLLHTRLDEVFQMRAETFFPGEPQKTQEQKAMLLGEESAIKDFIEALEEKDLELLEVEEKVDAEQIRNSPRVRSSAH
jgi:hypothetical protein